MVIAFKNGDITRKDLLRSVLGECDRVGRDLDDTGCIRIIRGMVKNARQMHNKDEELILSSYLPVMITGEKLSEIIDVLLLNSPTFGIGDVMRHLKDVYGESVDLGYASRHLKNVLNG